MPMPMLCGVRGLRCRAYRRLQGGADSRALSIAGTRGANRRRRRLGVVRMVGPCIATRHALFVPEPRRPGACICTRTWTMDKGQAFRRSAGSRRAGNPLPPARPRFDRAEKAIVPRHARVLRPRKAPCRTRHPSCVLSSPAAGASRPQRRLKPAAGGSEREPGRERRAWPPCKPTGAIALSPVKTCSQSCPFPPASARNGVTRPQSHGPFSRCPQSRPAISFPLNTARRRTLVPRPFPC